MLVFGKQVFFYILKRHKQLIKQLYLAKELDKKSFAIISKSGFKITKIDNKKAQALAKGGNHQGFLLDIKDFEFSPFEALKKDEFIVLLYGVSDVGNIGSIIRTAYALGVSSLIIIAKTVAMAGVIRSSSGAALDVKLCISEDIFAIINELKQLNFRIFASTKDGKEAHKIDFKGKKLLIMGSEGFGLPNKIIAKCDECVGIKMKNDFDSLNVSAAFAILCDRMVKNE
ncbi:23S rRNA (guanosine(2251)-2'-O)-methyltransferase RlmB [Campylobacter troglodytis]|uniref:23S rRNA (guanosine(2251)-2'-O)-methyltransferase RlmB n=1 Tax=Campylobacter troglodytis TaxID=654363 RepID=UPI00115A1FCF|nr:23S rRNA (guanosine(2251)-2'-O)-methyltransferase RlmB [Campylobacter troglodytis]TQR60799.1 23S rRNA (guanosine(2251)-2'-O)-methyltransferase RlmB [Campylobacter troglodytis]